jgi:hypothetical protein
MAHRLLLAGLIWSLLTASSAVADRPGIGGGGSRPNLGDRNDGDQDGYYYGSPYYYPPWGAAPVDPNAEEKRREEEKQRREAAREKAIRSHNDPQGGFFGPEDSPKNMFNDR